MDWNDGSVSSTFFASVQTTSFSHAYQSTGVFIVTGSASNIFSLIAMPNQTVSVYERIHDLHIDGDSSVTIPPGSGTWTVTAGPNQPPLDDIVCLWKMGRDDTDTIYRVPVLDSTTPHQRSFAYGPQLVSRETVSVNCSNAASSQYLMMDVGFLLDTSAMSCIDLAVPDSVIYEESWTINMSAWQDSTNAKVFCFNCNFAGIATEIVISGDHFESPGNYGVTSIDWLAEHRSRLIVTHDITVRARITALGVSTLPPVAVRNETMLELTVSVFGGTDVALSNDKKKYLLLIDFFLLVDHTTYVSPNAVSLYIIL